MVKLFVEGSDEAEASLERVECLWWYGDSLQFDSVPFLLINDEPIGHIPFEADKLLGTISEYF